MKKGIVFIGLIILHFSTMSFAQEFPQLSTLTNSWANHGSGPKEDTGIEIIADDFGNVFVTGYFQDILTIDTKTINAAGYSIFLAKFEMTGNILWLRHLHGADNKLHFGYGLGTDDEGNCYIAGFFDSTLTIGTEELLSYGGFDIFVAKFDPDGKLLWARNAGGTDLDEAQGLALDGSGNCYVTGYFGGVATFGTKTVTTNYGEREVFVAKYDPDGNILWVKQADGTALKWNLGLGITVDNTGNCWITGYFESRAFFDTITLISLGGLDIFVTKYDVDGNVKWAKQAGGIDWDVGNNIGVDSWGNCYVTGYFGATAQFDTVTLVSNLGEREIFIAKYDWNGNVVWAKQAEGTPLRWNTGWNIEVDGSGNSYTTGFFEEITTFDGVTLTSQGGRDVFIAKYGPDGSVILVYQAGGANWEECRGIAIDNWGNCLVTGYFEGTASFGNVQLQSAGGRDIFIASYQIPYVNVIFTATAPASTPPGDIVFITGSWNYWDPGSQALTNIAGNQWRIALPFSGGETVEYKYTRGNWDTVEKGPLGEEIADRSFTVPHTTHFQNDIIANWRDLPVSVSQNSGNEIPSYYFLSQNFPNPFNPETSIHFQLPRSEEVELSIYDVQGYKIRQLVMGMKAAGRHIATWDGRDEQGSKVASGVYFYRIQLKTDETTQNSFTNLRKMILLK